MSFPVFGISWNLRDTSCSRNTLAWMVDEDGNDERQAVMVSWTSPVATSNLRERAGGRFGRDWPKAANSKGVPVRGTGTPSA